MPKSPYRSRSLLAGLLAVSLGGLTLGGCATNSLNSTAATGPSTAQFNSLKSQVNTLNTRVTTLESLAPGLGEFMLGFQMHIAKAWYAGEAGNWDLAKFELGELAEGANGAEASRPKDAASLKAFVSGPLATVQTDVANKNKSSFESDYRTAINSCNGCHAGTIDSPKWPNGRGFIKITVPTMPPVGNQNFAP